MSNEYTRQRQGRDFSIRDALRYAEMSTEGNCNNIDGIIGNNDPKDDTEKKKSLFSLLEQCKTESERNAVLRMLKPRVLASKNGRRNMSGNRNGIMTKMNKSDQRKTSKSLCL